MYGFSSTRATWRFPMMPIMRYVQRSWRAALTYANNRRPHATPAALLLAVSAIVGIALRVHSIWSPRLWSDELFNFSLSQGSWITLLKRAALDMAHPPLFYALLKLWIYFVGSSMAWLRAFTVALSIVAFVPFIVLGRSLRLSVREMALASAMMAVNSYLIIYSYFLRPYSLLLLLTLCSHICFIKFLRRGQSGDRRSLLLSVVVNILLVYTHYFGWLVFAAQFFWVAILERSHLRWMMKVAGLLLLSYLPWVAIIVYTSIRVSYTLWDQLGWDVRPDTHVILLLLRSFNGGFDSTWLTLIGSLVFLLFAMLAMQHSWRSKSLKALGDINDEATPLALLAWLTLFPIVISFVAAWALTWIWMPRYVIVSTVPYLLLVAASAFRFPLKFARAATVAFALAWSVIAGFAGGDLVDALHGPNAPSYWLALSLSRAETRSQGPIRIYGLSPYAEQGLRLALSITGERRFITIPCKADCALPDGQFWIAITEHDPAAAQRVSELASDPDYSLGEPIYSGAPPQRHMLIPIRVFKGRDSDAEF